MILLNKGQSNVIVVTLTELKDELLPDYWLFVFSLDQAQGDEEYTYRIQLTDTSTSTNRYNLFTLVEGVDITFDLEGDYKYQVYQMPNNLSTDETEGELVETGKMRLIGIDVPDSVYSVSTNTSIYND
jgi:hypothetical protein